MHNKKPFKEKIIGMAMPLLFSGVLIIAYLIFSPSLLFYPVSLLLQFILICWAIIEVMMIEGESKLNFDATDYLFKAGSLSGLILSVGSRDTGHTFMVSLGFILLILGIVIRYLAMKTLGVHFSYSFKTDRNNQSVVDYGVYKYIRHPGYLGILMIVLSLPLIHGSFPGFGILAILSWLCIIKRICHEEKIMIDNFGDVYEIYAKGTKKLIPFLY